MLFPVHLLTVSSLWSTMWSKTHSHMPCSLLTSRAITAQSTTLLSGIFFLQNWTWGYYEGCCFSTLSLTRRPFCSQQKEACSHTYTHSEYSNRGLKSPQQCAYTKNFLNKAAFMGWKKIMHSNYKQKQAWQTTLFLSCSPSCPILASSHKHIRGAVKVQLG